MQAASARHNDQECVRRRGATVSERARQSRRWCDMEKKHGAQHYNKERFRVHLRFVMPCRARKLTPE